MVWWTIQKNIRMEEIHRTRYLGREQNSHTLPGTPQSQHQRMFTNLESLRTPCVGDFMEAPSCMHNWSLTPFLTLLWRMEKDWKFQASNHGSVFLVTRPHPEVIWESTQSCLTGTKDTHITQEIPRDLGAQIRNQGHWQNIRTKHSQCSTHLENYKGIRSSVLETNICIYTCVCV